ncbi:hypothetical protein C823_005126 [Eubacterium plexicaudatum ASF492]|nr:hypothetical protein C823_005126 [Eubacterium plexicaudatum ASF492]
MYIFRASFTKKMERRYMQKIMAKGRFLFGLVLGKSLQSR